MKDGAIGQGNCDTEAQPTISLLVLSIPYVERGETVLEAAARVLRRSMHPAPLVEGLQHLLDCRKLQGLGEQTRCTAAS